MLHFKNILVFHPNRLSLSLSQKRKCTKTLKLEKRAKKSCVKCDVASQISRCFTQMLSLSLPLSLSQSRDPISLFFYFITQTLPLCLSNIISRSLHSLSTLSCDQKIVIFIQSCDARRFRVVSRRGFPISIWNFNASIKIQAVTTPKRRKYEREREMTGISITCSCFSSSNLAFRRTMLPQNDGFRAMDTHKKRVCSPRILSSPSTEQNYREVRAKASSTISAPKREKDPKKRIVITGMGLVSVLGNDVDSFYDKLLNGESGISIIDKFDASDYTVRIAGQVRDFSTEGYIDTTKYQLFDDSWRYCLVAAKKALRDANLSPQDLKTMDRLRMGVIVGSGCGGIGSSYNAVDAVLKQEYEKASNLYYPTNVGSALIAMESGFMGPTYSISTACSTANYCFYSAANHIKRGEADIMVAGGTEAGVVPCGISGFIACKALSRRNDEPQKASRPWDKDRDGFVLSEGCGLLVMESLEHANERGAKIIAEYLGGAITCDAHHPTDPRLDGLGVAACIAKSLQNAGVSPQEVNYINPHATSTNKGDLAEINGIKKVFKDTSGIKMNGTKSLIGHAIAAAAGLEAIATIRAITTGWLHPTINQYNLEPEVTIDTIPNTKIKHDVNVAISNSFGFGGHNAVLVFAPFTP